MIYAIKPVLLGVFVGVFYIACGYSPKADSQEQRIEVSCVPIQFGNHYASGQMCDMPNGDRCYLFFKNEGGGISCIPANQSLMPPAEQNSVGEDGARNHESQDSSDGREPYLEGTEEPVESVER